MFYPILCPPLAIRLTFWNMDIFICYISCCNRLLWSAEKIGEEHQQGKISTNIWKCIKTTVFSARDCRSQDTDQILRNRAPYEQLPTFLFVGSFFQKGSMKNVWITVRAISQGYRDSLLRLTGDAPQRLTGDVPAWDHWLSYFYLSSSASVWRSTGCLTVSSKTLKRLLDEKETQESLVYTHRGLTDDRWVWRATQVRHNQDEVNLEFSDKSRL